MYMYSRLQNQSQVLFFVFENYYMNYIKNDNATMLGIYSHVHVAMNVMYSTRQMYT